jgi:hypothetical protein
VKPERYFSDLQFGLYYVFLKVYCKLCSASLFAKGDNIKKHCEGYYTGSGDKRTFKESAHARLAKARDEREAKSAPAVMAHISTKTCSPLQLDIPVA